MGPAEKALVAAEVFAVAAAAEAVPAASVIELADSPLAVETEFELKVIVEEG